jgi:hypothetical protein
MKPTLFALALTLVASQALAQSRPYYDSTYYDSSGRTARHSTTDCQDTSVSIRACRLARPRAGIDLRLMKKPLGRIAPKGGNVPLNR